MSKEDPKEEGCAVINNHSDSEEEEIVSLLDILLDTTAGNNDHEQKQRRNWDDNNRNLLILLLLLTILFLSIALIVVGAVALRLFFDSNNNNNIKSEITPSIPASSFPMLEEKETESNNARLLFEQEDDEDAPDYAAGPTISGQHNLVLLNEVTKHEEVERGCETTLILVRHCYDNGPEAKNQFGDKHCSYQGLEQSHYLASQFATDENDELFGRWPTPTHLFSIMFHQLHGFNYRMWETLKPLSDNTPSVALETIWYEEFQQVFFDMLASGNICGQVSVASVKHAFLPALAYRLGCGIKEGCPPTYDELDFDTVQQLKFVYDPPQVPESYLQEQAVVFEQQLRFTNNKKQQRTQPRTKEEVVMDEIFEDILLRTQEEAALGGEEENATDFNATFIDSNNTIMDPTTLKPGLPGWKVYGATVHQRFDPLAFSTAAGDYHPSGIPTGGRWMRNSVKTATTTTP